VSPRYRARREFRGLDGCPTAKRSVFVPRSFHLSRKRVLAGFDVFGCERLLAPAGTPMSHHRKSARRNHQGAQYRKFGRGSRVRFRAGRQFMHEEFASSSGRTSSSGRDERSKESGARRRLKQPVMAKHESASASIATRCSGGGGWIARGYDHARHRGRAVSSA